MCMVWSNVDLSLLLSLQMAVNTCQHLCTNKRTDDAREIAAPCTDT